MTPAPVRDTRTEKQVERDIIRALETIGYAVWKLSQPRNTMQSAGLADLFAAGHGTCAWVEVKTAKGKQRPSQAAFEAEVTANGGTYLLARSVADVIEWHEGRAA